MAGKPDMRAIRAIGSKPKKVVSVIDPTPEEIAERAAEIRAGWNADGCRRSVNRQGRYRIAEVQVVDG